MRTRLLLVALASLATTTACGSSDEGSQDTTPEELGDPTDPNRFDPPAPAQGTTRVEIPVVKDIQPGDDVMYCQYVLEPFDRDMDILSVGGHQSRMGHHIVAFATTADVPVGTSRLCQGEDNLSGAFLGGVGGEAGTGNVLPDGVAFRLPKGSGIMVNTHFLNTTTGVLDGKGVLDIEFAEVDPSRRVASFFVNINMGFTLPPGETTSADATCVIPKDMEFIAFSNHLHDYGDNIFTEVTRADTGNIEMIRNDPKWSYEMQFAAEYSTWGVDAPMVLHAGDQLHTRCTWNNTSEGIVTYPREMCVGSGFFLSDEPSFPLCFNGNFVDGTASDPAVLNGPACAEDGATGNEFGVGAQCTKGGGECPENASVCLADYTEGTWGNFCTRLCSVDADCGEGASCTSSNESSATKVCIPTACVGTAVPAE